jgi:hypothetical protein
MVYFNDKQNVHGRSTTLQDVRERWKSFNVKNATTTTTITWDEIHSYCMSDTWRNLWPECVANLTGYQEKTLGINSGEDC